MATRKKTAKKKAAKVTSTPIIDVAVAWYTGLPTGYVEGFREILRLDEPISQQCEDILLKIERSGSIDQTELLSLAFVMLLTGNDNGVTIPREPEDS